jgi:hypothetical protein
MRAAFDLRHKLGRELLDEAALWVRVSARVEADPSNQPWRPLSPDYAAWKEATHPGQPIGVLSGEMLDDIQVFGVRRFSRDEASMTYGQDETAKNKASWFQEGDPHRNRPPRPFYALAEPEAIEASDLICLRHLDDLLHRTGNDDGS